MITTAYYDRRKDSIEGLFTVRTVENGIITKEFKQLKARSGQRGHENTSWERGFSPIPFGEYHLWIDKPLQPWQKAGKTGIGHFLRISSFAYDRTLIRGNINQIRQEIGLHPENGYIGSAGCIVLIDMPEIWEMFKYLDSLKEKQDSIKLIVL